jgi:hypothetical protein
MHCQFVPSGCSIFVSTTTEVQMIGETSKFIDSYGSKRVGIHKACAFCEKEFITRRKSKREQIFCSESCKYQAKRKRVIVECSMCHKQCEKTLSKLLNSKHKIYFCDRTCKDKGQTLEGGIKEIMPPHYGTHDKSLDYRGKFTKKELYCKRCGYNEFTCSVHIHHKDKNRKNNSKNNLTPLCGNCHLALHKKLWKIEDLDNGSVV